MTDEEFSLSDLNPEDQKIIYNEVQRVFGSEKIGNIHEFLAKVIQEEDTTKMGYLSKEELGYPHLTLRALKELSIMSKEFDLKDWGDYFERMSTGVVTSPSLSKEGFLILAAITEKKKLEAKLPGQKKENKGWFRSRNTPESTEGTL